METMTNNEKFQKIINNSHSILNKCLLICILVLGVKSVEIISIRLELNPIIFSVLTSIIVIVQTVLLVIVIKKYIENNKLLKSMKPWK